MWCRPSLSRHEIESELSLLFSFLLFPQEIGQLSHPHDDKIGYTLAEFCGVHHH